VATFDDSGQTHEDKWDRCQGRLCGVPAAVAGSGGTRARAAVLAAEELDFGKSRRMREGTPSGDGEEEEQGRLNSLPS